MFSTQGKVIKCRAAILWSKGGKLSVEEIEVAVPEKKEVRIKIISTGICHSDLTYLEGFYADQKYPLLLGHEAAAMVESVGEEVTLFQPGDRVIPLFLPQCQECNLCKNPDTNLCVRVANETGKMEGEPKSIKRKGEPVVQMTGIGSFSEYTVVPEIRLAKINPKSPLEKVSSFGCCFPTGYGAAVFCAKVKPDSICAIWGLGAVGMSVAMGCRSRGAKSVIGVDINPDKFPQAKKFGCTEFVNPKDYEKPVEDILLGMTKGGVDYSFVAVGNKEAMYSAVNASRIGVGQTVLIGIISGGDVCINPMSLLMGRTIKGTFFGDTKGLTDVPEMINDYLEGKLPTDDLITQTISLDDINKGFDMLKKGEALRTVILMEKI